MNVAGGPGLDSETGDLCTTEVSTFTTLSVVCATNARFPQSRFTGKERDREFA